MSIRDRPFNFFIITVISVYAILCKIYYPDLNDFMGAAVYGLFIFLSVMILFLPFIGPLCGLIIIFMVYLYTGSFDIVALTSELLGPGLTPVLYVFSVPAWFVAYLFGLFYTVLILRIRLLYRKASRLYSSCSNLALINCTVISFNSEPYVMEDAVILIDNSPNYLIRKRSPEKLAVEYPEIYDRYSKVGAPLGYISAIGNKNEIEIPKGYKVIDLKGAFVLPGMINMHCHLMGSGKPINMEMLSKLRPLLMKCMKIRAVRLLIKLNMLGNILNALYSGVTLLRTMGDPDGLDIEIRDAIRKARLVGPRLRVAGSVILPSGGHGDFYGTTVDSPAEIRKAVRKRIRDGCDHIKIMSTGGVVDAKHIGEAGMPQMLEEEIREVCRIAHRGNLTVAAHCESTIGLNEAVAAGVDTIEHGADISDETLELMKKNPKALRGYTALIPTVMAGMGIVGLPPDVTKVTAVSRVNAEIIIEGQIKGLRKAYRSGVKLGIGSDASVSFSPHFDLWRELYYFTLYTDMGPAEAIYYATRGNAEILNLDSLIGTVSTGMIADLVVLDKNPLDDITSMRKIKHVIIGGLFIRNPRVKVPKIFKKYSIPDYTPSFD